MGSAGKRVLIIVQNMPVPFDRRVWLEATSLQENGYEVTVICPKMKGFNRTHERLESVEIYRYLMPFDPSTKVGFIGEFAWAWAASAILSIWIASFGRGFDVIHACNPPDTFWLLGRIWGVVGKRFLFDHHDLSPEMYQAKFGQGDGLFYRALLAMERETFRAADIALATNESHRKVAIERGHMSPDDVFVVRSGPDLARLSLYQVDDSWRNGKEHLIAYLGDISRQDGVDGLIRVASRLREKRDDFHFVVIGGGSAWEEVRRYAGDAGVAHLITFTGVVTDEVLCRALSSATLGVDTAPKNPWSNKSTMNKIMEYMYFGLPIIAYDLLETRRSAAEAAAIVESGSDSEFADLVDALLDDPQRRREMSVAGRQRVREQLSWDHSLPHLLEAYERVFNGLKPRP